MSLQNCKEGKSLSESALGQEKIRFWSVVFFFFLFLSPSHEAVAITQTAFQSLPGILGGAGERRVLSWVSRASHGLDEPGSPGGVWGGESPFNEHSLQR